MHNVQQMKDLEQSRDPLRLEDDPLAYLGILVDCLEEWDRYSVFPIIGRLPLQSSDVKLTVEGRAIVVDYGDPNRAAEVRKSLELTLLDWKSIVTVNPLPQS